MTDEVHVSSRDRTAILQSVRAGLVPRRGQHLIQVGRHQELAAIVEDLDRVADGGSMVRFVIGPYGSGKTYFGGLSRAVALERGFVTVHADLSPDRRLHSTSGHGRALYRELMRNMATRTQPEGGALTSVLERFLAGARQEASDSGGNAETVIAERLTHLTEFVGGFEFAEVVRSYLTGFNDDDEALSASAVRWMRAEYPTRTEARKDLGVGRIVDDANVHDSLKLMARFVRAAGYTGLIVVMDEMVNLYTLASTQARRSNYERVLHIVNDGLQGSGEGLGVLMAGTPEFLTDPARGLFSYEALQTRLLGNQFARDGLKDFSGPVIRLPSLVPEELFVLLGRIRHVHASGQPEAYLIPDDAITAFMDHVRERIGSSYFQTPRATIRAFVHLLDVLDQNSEADWRKVLGTVEVEPNRGASPQIDLSESAADASSGLRSFRL